MARYLYICKEFILWKWNVLKLLFLVGVSWCLYKYYKTQEYRTLYLSCKHSYDRLKTL